MLQKLFSLYRLINILSIDVAFGAVCSAIFFKHVLQADITGFSLVSLGLSVWVIYTVDHLLDAKKISTLAKTNRHRFHQEHFRLLSVFVFLAASINVILLFFIRKPALITGIVLLALVMLYLLIQHSLKFIKELFVAVVYTTGVMLPALANTHMAWMDWNWMMITQFALVAFLNLIIFSWFDYENDLQENRISFVTILGKRSSQIFIAFLFIVSAILLAVTFSFQIEASILFVMNVILLFLFIGHSYFSHDDRYRLLGDAVFFVPLLVLLF